MTDYDKRKSHISSKTHVTYKPSSTVRHPVAKTFTTLHPTTLHSTPFTHTSSITDTGVGIPSDPSSLLSHVQYVISS